jgi:hypothetical protein
MTDWLVLSATLPTSPSGLRVRVWRALKATGCATLREGVYLLPAAAASAAQLRALAQTIRDAGAAAHLLQLQASDPAQEQAFRNLFDRSGPYADYVAALQAAHRLIDSAPEAALRRQLRQLDQQLQALRATDHFPGEAARKAAAGLQALRAAVDRRLSPDEPSAGQGPVQRLAIADHQGRLWATRRRPWVDRLATAWLVRRHIDRSPRFLWLDDIGQCPPDAIGYDFDGARFSHVGRLVTFEVVAASFGLDADPALRRLGELVRAIDIGGVVVDEAPGIEALVRGLQARHADDDRLLAAACDLFDALHAALRPTA